MKKIFVFLNQMIMIMSAMTTSLVGNVFLGTSRKKLGDVVFFRRNGQTVARIRVRKIKNPQTPAQAAQRSRLMPLVNSFRALNGVLFARLRLGRSQWNQFVSNNLRARRPTTLAEGVNAIYENEYPFLVPPTPKDGTGSGLPTPMPLIVTQGRYQEPRYGVSFPGNGLINIIGRNNASHNGVAPLNPAQFLFNRPNLDVVIKAGLTQIGVTINTSAAGTETLDARQAEQLTNFIISRNRFIHTGFLGMFFEADGPFKEARYGEIGDMMSGTGTVTWNAAGVITIYTATITNSEGDTFVVTANMTTNTITVQVMKFVPLSNATTNMDSAVILSRRQGGVLNVSTSQMMLTIAENDVNYQLLFTQESIDRAIADYQRAANQVDSTNLSLNVD